MMTFADHKLNPRAAWQNIQGYDILTADLSHSTPAESLELLATVTAELKAKDEPIRILLDVTGAEYEPSVANKWKAVGLEHDAKIKALAFYGSVGLIGMAIRSYIELMELLGMGRFQQKMRLFKTKDEAVAWLLKKQ